MIGRPNVVIVDDHSMFREALRDYIASSNMCTSVTAVADLETAEREVLDRRNVLVLLDITLGEESGIVGIPRLQRAAGRRGLKILCISMHGRASVVRAALDSGADGYISKESSGERLKEAIEEVAAGRKYIDPDVEAQLAESLRTAGHTSSAERYAGLTAREQEVFSRLARGEKSAQIARGLRISPKTVDAHRYNIFRKMALHTIADLVRVAIEIGVV